MNSGTSDFLNASRWVAAFFVSSNWALPELDTNCRSSMGRKIAFKSRGIWGMSVENYFARVEAAATALVARLMGASARQQQYDKLMGFRQFWALIAATFGIAAAIYVVLARSGAAAPPSGFTYMPLGDSITQGYSTTRGYRCPLQARLVDAGYDASAVGRSGFLGHGFIGGLLIRYLGWTIGGDCPDNWEGTGSSTTAEIQAWFDADNSITQLKPNIILVLVGNKDVRTGNISQGPNDFRNMLTDIFTQSPNSWVVVSTIPPMGSQVQFFDQVPAYNAAMMHVAAEFPRVSTIDFYTPCHDIINQCVGDDGIHPTQAGFDVLTPLWFHAIQSIAPGPAEIKKPR